MAVQEDNEHRGLDSAQTELIFTSPADNFPESEGLAKAANISGGGCER